MSIFFACFMFGKEQLSSSLLWVWSEFLEDWRLMMLSHTHTHVGDFHCTVLCFHCKETNHKLPESLWNWRSIACYVYAHKLIPVLSLAFLCDLSTMFNLSFLITLDQMSQHGSDANRLTILTSWSYIAWIICPNCPLSPFPRHPTKLPLLLRTPETGACANVQCSMPVMPGEFGLQYSGCFHPTIDCNS